MSQLREERQVVITVAPRRNYLIEIGLIVVGAIVALAGLYEYLAPASWLWAGLSEAWYLGSWVVGGILMGVGFSVLGMRLRNEYGHAAPDATLCMVLGVVAFAGAIAFAIVWAL